MSDTQTLKMITGAIVAPTMIITPVFFFIYCSVLIFTETK